MSQSSWNSEEEEIKAEDTPKVNTVQAEDASPPLTSKQASKDWELTPFSSQQSNLVVDPMKCNLQDEKESGENTAGLKLNNQLKSKYQL